MIKELTKKNIVDQKYLHQGLMNLCEDNARRCSYAQSEWWDLQTKM